MALTRPFIFSLAAELVAEILNRVKRPRDLLALTQVNSTMYEHAIPRLLRAVYLKDRETVAGFCKAIADHAEHGRLVRELKVVDGFQPPTPTDWDEIVIGMIAELLQRLPRLQAFGIGFQASSHPSFSSDALWTALKLSCPSVSSVIVGDPTIRSSSHAFYDLDPKNWTKFSNALAWSSGPLSFYPRASNLQELTITFPPWLGDQHAAAEFWHLRFPNLTRIKFIVYGHLTSAERTSLRGPPPASFDSFWLAHPHIKALCFPPSITWTPPTDSLMQLTHIRGPAHLWLWALQTGNGHRRLASIVHCQGFTDSDSPATDVLNINSPLFGGLLSRLSSLEPSLESLSIRAWPNTLQYGPTLHELARVLGPYLRRLDLSADHLWGWLFEEPTNETQTVLACLVNMSALEILYVSDWMSSSGWTTPKHDGMRTAIGVGHVTMEGFQRDGAIAFTGWVRNLAARCLRLRKVRLNSVQYPNFYGTGVSEPCPPDLCAVISRVQSDPGILIHVESVRHEHEPDIDEA